MTCTGWFATTHRRAGTLQWTMYFNKLINTEGTITKNSSSISDGIKDTHSHECLGTLHPSRQKPEQPSSPWELKIFLQVQTAAHRVCEEEGGSHPTPSAVTSAPSTTHTENQRAVSWTSSWPWLSSPTGLNSSLLKAAMPQHLPVLLFPRLFLQPGMLCKISFLQALRFNTGRPFYPGSVADSVNVPVHYSCPPKSPGCRHLTLTCSRVNQVLLLQLEREEPAAAGSQSTLHGAAPSPGSGV